MKVTRITKLQPGIYAYVCPLCGEILASASEPGFMPDFSICDCDRNVNKQPAYELFEQDGKTMIRRNKPPRFVGEVTMGELSDIENVRWFDSATLSEVTSAMRKAGEFLLKISRRNKEVRK